MSFGSVLHAKRKELGLTLERVGKRISASKSYLSSLETDSVAPPAAPVVRRLAKALDLDKFELMRLAWIPKVPKELRSILEDAYASKDQLQPAPPISAEAAAKVFKEVMGAAEGAIIPPTGRDTAVGNPIGFHGPLSLPVDQVPLREMGGHGP